MNTSELIKTLIKNPDSIAIVKIPLNAGFFVAEEFERHLRMNCFIHNVKLTLEKSGFWVKLFLIEMEGKSSDVLRVIYRIDELVRKMED